MPTIEEKEEDESTPLAADKVRTQAREEVMGNSHLMSFKLREDPFSIKVKEDQDKLEKVKNVFKASGKKVNSKLTKVMDEEINNYGLPKGEDTM